LKYLVQVLQSRIYMASECSQNNSTAHFTVTGADLVMKFSPTLFGIIHFEETKN